jgi:FMN phosphatase YigB (HAD superfamily)
MASTIDWTSVKALSFDIFGTLIDWESGIYNAARASAVGPYLPYRSETLNGIDDHDVKVQSEHRCYSSRPLAAFEMAQVPLDRADKQEGEYVSA